MGLGFICHITINLVIKRIKVKAISAQGHFLLASRKTYRNGFGYLDILILKNPCLICWI
jgi:hypothetical protein